MSGAISSCRSLDVPLGLIIATNRCTLNFRSLSGVLRTWMGERPSLRPARMTPSGRSAVNFAVLHNGPHDVVAYGSSAHGRAR